MALACACAAPRAAHSGESSHLGLKRAVSRRRYPPAPVWKRDRRMARDRRKSLQLFPCSRYFVRFDSLAVIPAPEKPRSCGRGGAVCATSPVPPEQRRFALPIHLRHLQPLPGRLVLKTRAASGRIARRIARDAAHPAFDGGAPSLRKRLLDDGGYGARHSGCVARMAARTTGQFQNGCSINRVRAWSSHSASALSAAVRLNAALFEKRARAVPAQSV